VAGVDVHDGEREAGRAEGLLGEAQQDDGVLASREEQDGPLELGGDLAHDEDGLRLQGVQVADAAPHGALGQRSRLDHLLGGEPLLWAGWSRDGASAEPLFPTEMIDIIGIV
jgi:hypothetical protein